MRTSIAFFVRTFAACLLVHAHSAAANCPALFVFSGQAAFDLLGQSVAELGDVNRDGIRDFAIGAPGDDSGGLNAGAVYVRSGADGSLLHVIAGPPGLRIGVSMVNAGDVNADGADDILTSNCNNSGQLPFTPIAFVYSGADGSLLWRMPEPQADSRFASALAGPGDLNGDGYADIAIGAFRYSTPSNFDEIGAVYIYSGVDGSLLRSMYGESSRQWFGFSLGSLADVNGDGCRELIVGAIDPMGLPQTPAHLYVISGCDGAAIHAIHEPPVAGAFPTQVAGLGDIDGGGKADFAAGAWTGQNVLWVYRGEDGTPLYSRTIDATTFNGEEGFAVYRHAIGAGDVTGDGILDVLMGDTSFSFGRAFVFSGPAGHVQQRFFGSVLVNPGAFGAAIVGVGDLTGDGRSEVLIGGPNIPGPGAAAGRASLYRGGKSGDATCDGAVDLADLHAVIAAWGPCNFPCPPVCAPDLTGDCTVDVDDLLTVITNWG